MGPPQMQAQRQKVTHLAMAVQPVQGLQTRASRLRASRLRASRSPVRLAPPWQRAPVPPLSPAMPVILAWLLMPSGSPLLWPRPPLNHLANHLVNQLVYRLVGHPACCLQRYRLCYPASRPPYRQPSVRRRHRQQLAHPEAPVHQTAPMKCRPNHLVHPDPPQDQLHPSSALLVAPFRQRGDQQRVFLESPVLVSLALVSLALVSLVLMSLARAQRVPVQIVQARLVLVQPGRQG